MRDIRYIMRSLNAGQDILSSLTGLFDRTLEEEDKSHDHCEARDNDQYRFESRHEYESSNRSSFDSFSVNVCARMCIPVFIAFAPVVTESSWFTINEKDYDQLNVQIYWKANKTLLINSLVDILHAYQMPKKLALHSSRFYQRHRRRAMREENRKWRKSLSLDFPGF